MSETIKGLDHLNSTLDKMQRFMKSGIDKSLYKVTAEVRNDMQKRTLSGRDKNERRFKGYAKSTEKMRAENHRATDRVTLSYYGHMLNSMQVTKISGGGKIYFNDMAEERKANYHVFGTDKMDERDFFGLSKKNREYAISQVDKDFVQAVR